MNISDVIELLEQFDCDVVYSDITLGVHYGCSCCGGDSYDDESWNEMSLKYSKTEEKIKKFCDEHNLVYDFGADDEDMAKMDFVNKSSFDTLFNLFVNSNISAVIEDYGDDIQAYHDMRDYYAEDLEIFLNFCVSLGFKNNF